MKDQENCESWKSHDLHAGQSTIEGRIAEQERDREEKTALQRSAEGSPRALAEYQSEHVCRELAEKVKENSIQNTCKPHISAFYFQPEKKGAKY